MDKIDITDSAQEYLSELLSKQEDPTNIKIFVSEPGTPKAETCIVYCKEGEQESDDLFLELEKINVFLFNTIIRFKDVLIDKGHRGSELYGLSLPSSASNITKQGDRNLVNLFEFPIFFYTVCVSIYITGKVDSYFVLLAYWFVGFRVLHSLYHIFINGFLGALPIRALFFVPSWAIVVWMWFRFIQML